MTQSCREMVQLKVRNIIKRRVLILCRCISCFCDKVVMCSLKEPIRYRMLPYATVPPPPKTVEESGFASGDVTSMCHNDNHDLGLDSNSDSDLVPLKISLLGDCQIGKTSFLEKYVGNEKEQGGIQRNGLNLIDKTLMVKGARISYSIWEVEGDEKFQDHIPIACKDSVAILIMFDLTSRCTLNSVIRWYQEARKWNQTAIPILIGTKFDDFIQLPIDLQWTIASQARAYAKALNATLFFSSATYNINVNKVFKFITAKLFDLPWTVERNLTIGEPLIDF
ncbi:Miro domain-containing protein [Cephalotus follicularis]|uniref:Miro domain-containing protein n=1 Tax=Cephalotus follicularis TaxID=3775 RepID=A0A1Q3DAW1_CEPFO|nr:Miro domain-containing protein [Cephalotus follicularis]